MLQLVARLVGGRLGARDAAVAVLVGGGAVRGAEAGRPDAPCDDAPTSTGAGEAGPYVP